MSHLTFLAGMSTKAWNVFKATGWITFSVWSHLLVSFYFPFDLPPSVASCVRHLGTWFSCDMAVLNKWLESMILDVFPNLSISMILLQAAALFCLWMVPDALGSWPLQGVIPALGIHTNNTEDILDLFQARWAIRVTTSHVFRVECFSLIQALFVQPTTADEALMRIQVATPKRTYAWQR